MPADIDVLVGGTSPLTFSSNYLSYNRPNIDVSCPTAAATNYSSSPTHFTFHGRCTSPLSFNFSPLCIQTENRMPVAVPRRPCLVVRCYEEFPPLLDPPSPGKHKKKVVFADDRGFPLTKVRTMTEPSNMPPRWSLQFISQVTQGACAEVAPEPWEPTFSQPASDYLEFRRRIDTCNVCLENVIIRETDQAVIGTVKVRNIAFDKEVVVRVTSDGWKTHEDVHCTYAQPSPSTHGVAVIYDTFSFRLTLPPRQRTLEFCVRYRCNGTDHWDNNNGKNYFIVKKDPIPQPPGVNYPIYQYEKHTINLSRKFSDSRPDATIEAWSEFASWNHLTNDTPYW